VDHGPRREAYDSPMQKGAAGAEGVGAGAAVSTIDADRRNDRRLLDAVRVLNIDRTTAEVAPAMSEAGVPTVLLKGLSIARWLYPSGGRTYCDADILVAPSTFARAKEVLRSLGFDEALHGFASFERDLHDAVEVAFVREGTDSGGRWGVVDLHQSLPLLSVSNQTVWDTLSAETETLVVAGVDVRVLNHGGLALHIVVHAVQHNFEHHTDEDLRRAIRAASIDDWRRAADIGRRLGIEDVLGFGLRRHAEGAELADRLGLPDPSLAESAFFWNCAGSPRGAESLSMAWSAPSLLEKARVVRWKLFPSPAKIRYQVPEVPQSLALAYVRVLARRRQGGSRSGAFRHGRTPPSTGWPAHEPGLQSGRSSCGAASAPFPCTA